jgi:hypothetical protein
MNLLFRSKSAASEFISGGEVVSAVSVIRKLGNAPNRLLVSATDGRCYILKLYEDPTKELSLLKEGFGTELATSLQTSCSVWMPGVGWMGKRRRISRRSDSLTERILCCQKENTDSSQCPSPYILLSEYLGTTGNWESSSRLESIFLNPMKTAVNLALFAFRKKTALRVCALRVHISNNNAPAKSDRFPISSCLVPGR